MCGIFACLHSGSERGKCLKRTVVERLKRRGPDGLHEVRVPVAGGNLQLDLLGTLLCMRGKPTPLPLGNEAGDWLLWNGNMFGGDIKVGPGENDTVKMLEALSSALTHTEMLNVLSVVHGPWSFVFWQASTQSLWFGRDVFGRRSLLWHLPQAGADDCLALSSVGHFDPSHSPAGHWLEVPAVGIFQLKCTEDMTMEAASLLCYPWMQGDITFQSEEEISHELGSLETCLSVTVVKETNPQVFFPPLNQATVTEPHAASPSSNCHASAHQQDIPERTAKEKRPESTDVVSHPTRETHHKPETSTPPPSAETMFRITYRDSVAEFLDVLQSAVQCRVSRAPSVGERKSIKQAQKKSSALEAGIEKEEVGERGRGGGGEGVASAESGVQRASASARSSSPLYGSANVAILFSGGVDSAVLAALADRCLDPSEEVDLINVAFELKHLPAQDPSRFNVPDRLSGLACLQELNPKRVWNFVMVNVTSDEVNKMRSERIAQLVYPLNTVLDDSIGCALWFSARGEGLLYHRDPVQCRPYCSSARLCSLFPRCKTLFVGIGADEQLAGYSRHRTKFRSSGVAGVIREVEMDTKRLARRNLGRDDRCTADHQRDAQYPFLDERVVAYLQQLPMAIKADLSQPRGVGEKQLLRDVAASLHCHAAAALPKRAIQFGSRMAKLGRSSNGREHGTDTCDRLFSK